MKNAEVKEKELFSVSGRLSCHEYYRTHLELVQEEPPFVAYCMGDLSTHNLDHGKVRELYP